MYIIQLHCSSEQRCYFSRRVSGKTTTDRRNLEYGRGVALCVLYEYLNIRLYLRDWKCVDISILSRNHIALTRRAKANSVLRRKIFFTIQRETRTVPSGQITSTNSNFVLLKCCYRLVTDSVCHFKKIIMFHKKE